MSNDEPNSTEDLVSGERLDILRRRVRMIHLLAAAERACIAPIGTAPLHTFAYLADVLSPVWGLLPFDGKVLKSEGGPHYPDLQTELDRLVAMGLVDVSDVRYVDRPGSGARLIASYSLRFASPHLSKILAAIGASETEPPLDAIDSIAFSFLVELAGALAFLPRQQLEFAATVDATYADQRVAVSNLVEFSESLFETRSQNPSVQTTERFSSFLPNEASLSAGERLYLYASYLGRRIRHG